MMLKILLGLVLIVTHGSSKQAIPDYLHLCKRSDPNISDCIKKSIEDLRPQLSKGMPELKVPPIEPLYIKELTSARGNDIKVVTSDIYVKGCGNFQLESLKADIEKGIYEFEVKFPFIELDGKYKVDGKILTIPIKGEGTSHGEVTNAVGKGVLKNEMFDEGGEKRVKWTSLDLDVHVEKGKMQLDNLFGGEKVLGDAVNAAINLNFQTFFKEFKPEIEQVLKDFILESGNKIIEGYDYNDVFPE